MNTESTAAVLTLEFLDMFNMLADLVPRRLVFPRVWPKIEAVFKSPRSTLLCPTTMPITGQTS
jgi:hypothetical protein